MTKVKLNHLKNSCKYNFSYPLQLGPYSTLIDEVVVQLYKDPDPKLSEFYFLGTENVCPLHREDRKYFRKYIFSIYRILLIKNKCNVVSHSAIETLSPCKE